MKQIYSQEITGLIHALGVGGWSMNSHETTWTSGDEDAGLPITSLREVLEAEQGGVEMEFGPSDCQSYNGLAVTSSCPVPGISDTQMWVFVLSESGLMVTAFGADNVVQQIIFTQTGD